MHLHPQWKQKHLKPFLKINITILRIVVYRVISGFHDCCCQYSFIPEFEYSPVFSGRNVSLLILSCKHYSYMMTETSTIACHKLSFMIINM